MYGAVNRRDQLVGAWGERVLGEMGAMGVISGDMRKSIVMESP